MIKGAEYFLETSMLCGIVDEYQQEAIDTILEYMGELNRALVHNGDEFILRQYLYFADKYNWPADKRDFHIKRVLRLIPDEHDPRYFDISKEKYEERKLRIKQALDESNTSGKKVNLDFLERKEYKLFDLTSQTC